MKKIILLFTQKIEWCLTLIGSFMVTSGIINFSSGCEFKLGGKATYAYYYYYSTHDKIIITLGVVFLALGILIYKEKRAKQQ